MTDQANLFAADPAYHEGRKSYVEPERGSFASKLPEFKVELDAGRTANVTCQRSDCGKYLTIFHRDLPLSGEVRPCFFCWKSSRIP